MLVFLAIAIGLAQQPQFPSPMVDHTREHIRLPEQTPRGRREKLDIGTLYLPARLSARPALLLFFHGEGRRSIADLQDRGEHRFGRSTRGNRQKGKRRVRCEGDHGPQVGQYWQAPDWQLWLGSEQPGKG